MSKITARKKRNLQAVEGRKYTLDEAVTLLSSLSSVKFKERFEVAINLGIDARKSDQLIRRSSILPKGSGKDLRVGVFAQGEVADQVKEAGADVVGGADLVADIQKGNMDFDVLLVAPKDMAKLGRLGSVLGPRGLMPNPKQGTVTNDLVKAVPNAKSKQVRYKTDKYGIVHVPVGNINFTVEDIKENLLCLMSDLKQSRPVSAKGVFFKKLSLSTTMGPGLDIDVASLGV